MQISNWTHWRWPPMTVASHNGVVATTRRVADYEGFMTRRAIRPSLAQHPLTLTRATINDPDEVQLLPFYHIGPRLNECGPWWCFWMVIVAIRKVIDVMFFFWFVVFFWLGSFSLFLMFLCHNSCGFYQWCN